MDRVYANWRLGHPEGVAADGQPYAYIEPELGLSLFETIEQSQFPDEQTYILKRTSQAFAIMNIFPYTPGHILVLPKKAIPCIDEVPEDIHVELWALVQESVRVVKEVFTPHGLNVGVNEGRAGGGSQPDHLHVHIVPRWRADTNFMTTTAEARVLPQSLSASWLRLRDAWG